MKKSDAGSQHASNALVALTGISLAWFKYFATSSDPYSSATSPWQVVSYNAHILTAPLLVFAIGMIWHNHIWTRWKNATVREFGKLKIRTGRILLYLIVPMIASGYVLQVTTHELGRKVLTWVHLLTAGAWILGYSLHLANRMKERKKRRTNSA